MKKEEVDSMLFNIFLDYIKLEHHESFKNALKESKNFIKHADRDPYKEVELSELVIELFILDAINLYNWIEKGMTQTMQSFFVRRSWNNQDSMNRDMWDQDLLKDIVDIWETIEEKEVFYDLRKNWI